MSKPSLGIAMDGLLEISPSLFFKYAKSPHWIWYDLHGEQSLNMNGDGPGQSPLKS